MRIDCLVILLLISLVASAQEERDTTLRRCPVFITDTVTSNNFFIEGLSCTIKVYRLKGNLTVVLQQRDQYFTIFFNIKKLKSTNYKIKVGANNHNEVASKYSFRSGDQVSYVNVASGTVETSFDKEKDHWHIKVNGMLPNMVERSVTYYKVRSDFYIK
jgi:hypothetical protein